MSKQLPQPQNLFEKKLVHVFLGKSENGNIKINLLAPYHPEISKIECILSSAPFQDKQEVRVRDDIIRWYQFEFDNLVEGTTYSYRFTVDGQTLDLGYGLKESDLFFTYWSEIDENDSVVSMSCNGPYFFKDEKKKWDMWDRLHNEISTGFITPKLLILGGDQYYQDALEEKWLGKVNSENIIEFKKASLENALKHWEHISYRKVMAQIPSVAMLDDHDITDGANGDRDEFYVGQTSEFNESWKYFSGVQKELFSFLQASRNPKPLLKKENQAFTFLLDLGKTALVALDLRTEKNSRKKMVQEEDSKMVLWNTIRKLPHKNVMIVIPVVPVRNSLPTEAMILGGIASVPLLKTALARMLPEEMRNQIENGLDSLTGFEDDLTDALSSEPNKDFLFELLEVILEGASRGVNYTILSGDIHTAGSVELHISDGINSANVPILVASPIAYDPMPRIVETILREHRVITLKHKGITVEAINHAFSSDRNFMNIYPEKLVMNPIEAVQLFQEGVPGSKTVMFKGWNRKIAVKTDHQLIVEKSLKLENKVLL